MADQKASKYYPAEEEAQMKKVRAISKRGYYVLTRQKKRVENIFVVGS